MFALTLGLLLLFATPGAAGADSTQRQQVINSVIQRGLSQRGVPFAYGGGNTDGPTGHADPAPAPEQGSATILGAIPTATPAAAPPAGAPGFDASGLMVYSYAAAGVKLPRTSGDQYNFGRKVLPSEALPGDLIFYGPSGSQSVAMFVGNGQMLEATVPAVQVTSVRFNDMAPYLVRVVE